MLEQVGGRCPEEALGRSGSVRSSGEVVVHDGETSQLVFADVRGARAPGALPWRLPEWPVAKTRGGGRSDTTPTSHHRTPTSRSSPPSTPTPAAPTCGPTGVETLRCSHMTRGGRFCDHTRSEASRTSSTVQPDQRASMTAVSSEGWWVPRSRRERVEKGTSVQTFAGSARLGLGLEALELPWERAAAVVAALPGELSRWRTGHHDPGRGAGVHHPHHQTSGVLHPGIGPARCLPGLSPALPPRSTGDAPAKLRDVAVLVD